MIAPEEAARDGDLPVSACRDRRGADAGERGADRRRTRPSARRGGRAWPCALYRRRRRRGRLPQGGEPSRGPAPIPSLTPKDRTDLELALELEVDYVALSFVRKAQDVRELRQLIEHAGSHAEVIAKIEKPEAVDELDAILDATDAIMVARGDLGVEIGPAGADGPEADHPRPLSAGSR